MRDALANLIRAWSHSICIAAALGGCTAGEKAAAGSRYVVTAPHAQFYKYGPAQSFGPDFVLEKGQKVTMLERSFGYSRITTDQGVTGYISSDEVTPAPPEPQATPSPEVRGSVRSGRPKRSNVRGTPGLPLFDVNDVPMPLPGNPEPRSEPKFRY